MLDFLKRKANRIQAPVITTRGFAAAKQTNMAAKWRRTPTSIDEDLKGDLKSLRARSRDLSKNDPYFKRFLSLARQNVVGPFGITLQSTVQEEDKKGNVISDENAKREIEKAWKKWGKKKNCTVRKNMSWRMLQEIVVYQAIRDGEIFIRKVTGFKGNDFRFALQCISADHLDECLNKRLEGDNYIKMGIEFNSWHEPQAYWFWKTNPGDTTISTLARNERVRIPANEIVHVMLPEDANQTRGFPWGVASMLRSKMLLGYENSEVAAASLAARHQGFITSADGVSYEGDGTGENSDGQEVQISNMEDLSYEQLPHGMDYKPVSKDHPTTAYSSFTKGVLRGIASGLGVGYNTLANDYEGVNFSSLRQSNLTERDCWRALQQWLIETLHEDIFEEWLFLALARGEVNLPLAKIDKFNSCNWQPRGWQWVDPTKEVQAHETAMKLKIRSASSIAAEQGQDLEEIYKSLANEKELRAKYGLSEPEFADQAQQPVQPETPKGGGNDTEIDNEE